MRKGGDDGLWDVFHQKTFDAETQVLKWSVMIVKKDIYRRRDRRHSRGWRLIISL